MRTNLPDCNLKHLYIQVPIKWVDGHPVAFRYKAISKILEKQDVWELVILQEWLTKQILDYIGWDYHSPITPEIIAKMFEVYANLGIKPKECVHDEFGEILNMGDCNDTDE